MTLSQDQISNLIKNGWNIVQCSDDLFSLKSAIARNHYQKISNYLNQYTSDKYYRPEMIEIITCYELVEYFTVYVFSPNFINIMNNISIPRKDWDQILKIATQNESNIVETSLEEIALRKGWLQIHTQLNQGGIIYKQYRNSHYDLSLTIRGIISKPNCNKLIDILCDRNL